MKIAIKMNARGGGKTRQLARMLMAAERNPLIRQIVVAARRKETEDLIRAKGSSLRGGDWVRERFMEHDHTV